MRVVTARIVLFTIWFGMFLIYLGTTYVPAYRGQVDLKSSKETMWKFVYVLFPVITSFATFWFLPRLTAAKMRSLDQRRLDGSQVYAMFAFTFGLHALIAVFYWFTVIVVKYRPSSQSLAITEPQSYVENVDEVVKLLVFVSTALLLPVGYVLGERVTVGQPGGGMRPGKK